jgi:hypothetical protein
MKVSKGGIVFAVVVIAGILLARVATQPKYWPDHTVHSWLLEQLPIGTDRREVRDLLSRHGWLDSTALNPLHDLCDRGDVPPGPDIPEFRLRADFGNTWLIFSTNTEAFFAFDSTAHLTGLCVRHSTDAL